jgi:GRASP55/65 PDZ-like domain
MSCIDRIAQQFCTIKVVWNIKSQSARLVDIIPSDSWGGAGLLGVTIRLDNYAGAEERLIRVLAIESPKSPAAIAGLAPGKDFILGTTHKTVDSVDQLALILQQYEDEIVELYVYNTDDDRVRVVALHPTGTWDGSRGGLLGAEVGTGYLHRLPFLSRNTSGSSVARKVRYVQDVCSTELTIYTEAHDIARTGSMEKENSKVLEFEPQLEMEPALHDGLRKDRSLDAEEFEKGLQKNVRDFAETTDTVPEIYPKLDQ